MVNSNCGTFECSVQMARQTVLKLEDDKKRMENELKEWLEVLEKNHTNMNEALVDRDGYPRIDIDVHHVRNARHRVICIRNDLRNIMSEIEKYLHLIHAESSSSIPVQNTDAEMTSGTPIARVVSVTPGSPSDNAKLKVGDLITNFGSVNSSNFKCLADISNVIQYSINQLVKVIVLRNDLIAKLYLKPHPWSGHGMLGCIILPIEDVER